MLDSSQASMYVMYNNEAGASMYYLCSGATILRFDTDIPKIYDFMTITAHNFTQAGYDFV